MLTLCFLIQGDVTQLLPDLPHHPSVPMDPPGTPSLQKIAQAHMMTYDRLSVAYPGFAGQGNEGEKMGEVSGKGLVKKDVQFE